MSKAIGILYRLKSVYPLSVLLTLYNTLVLPYFNDGILTWGSIIKEDHHLHKLQKKAVRIITQSDYIAHTEPLCKQNRLIKLPNMFPLAVWKFYYKLMNNQLPIYFSVMKSVLPQICSRYEVRNPVFHLPDIRHSFAEQSIRYCLIKQLNTENGSTITTGMVHTSSFPSYNIPKYNYELNCRQRRRGGGVSLYIHSLLQYKTRPELQLGGEVNSVFVEILKNSLNAKKNVICGCIYRPPSMSLVTFNKLLCDMFGKILRENKYIYLIGDFNVNILHDVPGGLSTQEFKNIFSTNYCFPLINIPTRVTMNSASLIDNMYSNFPAQGNVCDSGVLKTSISDHYAIFCIANNAVVNKTCTQSTRRSFCDRNIANFNIALINTSWDFIYDNADMQSLYTSFQTVIDRLINTHFKMESFTTNYKNRHPWLTGPLRSQIKAKNRMYTEAIASGSAELMDKYKKRKNEVLSLLKNTEIMYFSDQMEINKNDLNKTWKILRIILGKDRNPSQRIQLLIWMVKSFQIEQQLLMVLIIILSPLDQSLLVKFQAMLIQFHM